MPTKSGRSKDDGRSAGLMAPLGGVIRVARAGSLVRARPEELQLTNRTELAALEFYRIRWALDDISVFVQMFRTRHRRTAGAEHTWLGLNRTLASTSS